MEWNSRNRGDAGSPLTLEPNCSVRLFRVTLSASMQMLSMLWASSNTTILRLSISELTISAIRGSVRSAVSVVVCVRVERGGRADAAKMSDSAVHSSKTNPSSRSEFEPTQEVLIVVDNDIGVADNVSSHEIWTPALVPTKALEIGQAVHARQGFILQTLQPPEKVPGGTCRR